MNVVLHTYAWIVLCMTFDGNNTTGSSGQQVEFRLRVFENFSLRLIKFGGKFTFPFLRFLRLGLPFSPSASSGGDNSLRGNFCCSPINAQRRRLTFPVRRFECRERRSVTALQQNG